MPNTLNFGFPLMADSPPEGTTGKGLRNMILGEGADSLANMADKTIAKVKNSVPPVDLENIDFRWDGVTAGLTVADGSLSHSVYNRVTVEYKYYKVLDNPIVSKADLKLSGNVTVDIGFELTAIFTYYNGEYMLQNVSDGVYAVIQSINGFGVSIPFLFSVHTPNTVYNSPLGKLTFPEVGLYVIQAVSQTGRFESIKTVPTPYNPDIMPGAAAEVTSHKVTAIGEGSTDTQYPSAKAVWDALSSHGGGIAGVKVNGSSLTPTDGEVDITVPTKTSQLTNNSGFLTSSSAAVTSKEDTANKSTDIKNNVNDTNYPTNKAVYDFVKSEVSEAALVSLPLAEWDGNVADQFSILGMYYKVSENTAIPGNIKFDISARLTDGSIERPSEMQGLSPESVVCDMQDSLGITVYVFGGTPTVVIAERSGTLPAAVIEQMTGQNPGADIPFEAGTYFFGSLMDNNFLFVSNLYQVFSLQQYVDFRLAKLTP